ncbi:hypothetical protein AAG906_010261 [Vitis piasezkii]
MTTMAITSSSAARLPPMLPTYNSSISHKLRPSSLSLLSNASSSSLKTLKPSLSSSRVFAAPELLSSQETPDGLEDSATIEVEGSETPGASALSMGVDADKMAPKQKIRIKLRSYWVPLIEDSCKQIMEAARTTNAKTMGPVPLPTKKKIFCVLKSPHVHKDARFHFEIRTHQRLIDILYPTAQTIDSLMQLDLPAGVDVEVKL